MACSVFIVYLLNENKIIRILGQTVWVNFRQHRACTIVYMVQNRKSVNLFVCLSNFTFHLLSQNIFEAGERGAC